MSEGDKLHAAIMNIPAVVSVQTHPDNLRWYRSGHRDARHAAAELVSAAWFSRDSEVERLREVLSQVRAVIALQRDVIERGKHSAAWTPVIEQIDAALSSQDKESA